MTDIKTSYLGLELQNPIIVGASNLSDSVEKITKLQKAGVGAIVFKSLFEEQIQLEEMEMEQEMEAYNERHAWNILCNRTQLYLKVNPMLIPKCRFI